MFTGIVETTGTVAQVAEGASARRIAIRAPELAPALELGDSVSVDGACLTVAALRDDGFEVDVIGTTLERTIAGTYRGGQRVNLERAARLGDRLDGHLVQGHIDEVGQVERYAKSGEFWVLDVVVSPDTHAQTVEHGSITVNGVSLTVSELLEASGVRIGVIPHTHRHTNLGDLRAGDAVNVEADLIGKYVRRWLAQRGPALDSE